MSKFDVFDIGSLSKSVPYKGIHFIDQFDYLDIN